jgi:signal transduction histidine kinase
VLEQRVADRNRELAALYDVTAVASEALPLPIMLARSLAHVLDAMRSQAGAIYLFDQEDHTLTLAVQQGQSGLVPVDAPLLGRVVANGEAWIIPDLAADPHMHALPPAVWQALALVPMHAAGQVLGILSIARAQGHPPFNVEETALLMTIADEVGVVVESARLRERAGQVAVMEERARLARDLHDSVTQLLYSLNLFARAGQEAHRQGKPAEVAHHLRELGAIAQQAFREMRLLVYELRPLALAQVGLVGALQQRLEAVEKRAAIETKLLAPAQALDLSARVEDALYHIAQEALNNALKHAGASQVTVRLGMDEAHVALTVADNGVGFDSQALADQGGLGLLTMRERAEQVGGTLTVQSAAGTGTTVRVEIERLGD